jgi:hypothetical protein
MFEIAPAGQSGAAQDGFGRGVVQLVRSWDGVKGSMRHAFGVIRPH